MQVKQFVHLSQSGKNSRSAKAHSSSRDWEFGFSGPRCHVSRLKFCLKYCHILNENGYIGKFPKQNDMENCMLRSIEERKFLKDNIESLIQEIEKMTSILSTLKL